MGWWLTALMMCCSVAHADASASPVPREGRGRVVVTSSTLTVLDPIRFARGAADLPRASHAVLDVVAETLKANAQLTRIAVIGQGTAGKARAAAVRSFLVEHGVEPQRLKSRRTLSLRRLERDSVMFQIVRDENSRT
jgi:outer membrane protein OmpA-like peptidoglycan-associated protein